MKALVANAKERKKFEAARPTVTLTELDLSLGYLQAELERIDARIRLAVARWQQAGRDPNDAFRGLVVSDEDASHLAELPFGVSWGDVAQDDEAARAAIERQAKAVRQGQSWLELAAQHGVVVRLQHLGRVFELSEFELDTLLLCLAPARHGEQRAQSDRHERLHRDLRAQRRASTTISVFTELAMKHSSWARWCSRSRASRFGARPS